MNAEKKLAEWAAEARERELEKVGLKHIRAQEKAALREARAQVRECMPRAEYPSYGAFHAIHDVRAPLMCSDT